MDFNIEDIENYKPALKVSEEVKAKHLKVIEDELPELMGKLEAYKEPEPAYEFQAKIAQLDRILKRIDDCEEKQFLILVWLRDETDPEAEAKIKEYERIYNVSAEELVHFYKSQA